MSASAPGSPPRTGSVHRRTGHARPATATARPAPPGQAPEPVPRATPDCPHRTPRLRHARHEILAPKVPFPVGTDQVLDKPDHPSSKGTFVVSTPINTRSNASPVHGSRL